MAICHCDGPPHSYDPTWCTRGLDGKGIIAESRPGVTIVINLDGWTR